MSFPSVEQQGAVWENAETRPLLVNLKTRSEPRIPLNATTQLRFERSGSIYPRYKRTCLLGQLGTKVESRGSC